VGHFSDIEYQTPVIEMFHFFMQGHSAFHREEGVDIRLRVRLPLLQAFDLLGSDVASGCDDKVIIIILPLFALNRLFIGINVDDFIKDKIDTFRDEITFGFHTVGSSVYAKRNEQPAGLIMMHFVVVQDGNGPFTVI